jgi:hypothetical protein
MTDDGPIIGSQGHNRFMGNLFLQLLDLGEQPVFAWHAANRLDLVLRWDDGTVDRLIPDLFLHRGPISPMQEELDVADAGAPMLVLEIGDYLGAKDATADADLRTAKVAWYLAIGVEEYLVYDIAEALSGSDLALWGRRRVQDGGGARRVYPLEE